MTHHIRATWVSRRERNLWCCDFGDFGDDHAALCDEIAASDAVICPQRADSLLLAVSLYHAPLTSEIVEFFRVNAERRPNPIRKLAIVGVTGWQQFWYTRVKHVLWPSNTRFFLDYEQAKDWLVDEPF